VRRAYHQPRAAGQPDRFAFEIGDTVYRWRSPAVEPAQADPTLAVTVWNGIGH
jgi:hypothetical protein